MTAVFQPKHLTPFAQAGAGVVLPGPGHGPAPRGSGKPPQAPETQWIEAENEKVAFRRQDPRSLPQECVRLGPELQAVNDDHRVHAVTGERQIVVPGAHIKPWPRRCIHDPLANGPRHIQGRRIAGRPELCHQTGTQARQQARHGFLFGLRYAPAERRSEPGLECLAIDHGACLPAQSGPAGSQAQLGQVPCGSLSGDASRGRGWRRASTRKPTGYRLWRL